MKFPLVSFFRDWAEWRRFNALDRSLRSIVFYAEDAASWVHFEPMIRELTGPMGRQVCYLTSSRDDPILRIENERIHAFCIGKGLVRTVAFLAMRADLLVMTMPDLETFHIKRSKVHPVRYVYVFHSIVSTHMIYRTAAFDHYDTVLCVGPHHVEEIRATEAAGGLKPKDLVEHGYGRLDTILASRSGCVDAGRRADEGKRGVLIAPSWGPNGLLETCGVELVDVLLKAGCRVTVRPHPMTSMRWPRVIRGLKERFADHPDFALETNVASSGSFERSDVMISDWSGAALEYAFGFERPALFVDVPRKVNNPDYVRVPCAPLEVTIREEVGAVASPEKLSEVPGMIESLCGNPTGFRDRIRAARSRTVYNTGSSGAVGASHIARIVDEAVGREVSANGAVAVPG